LTVEKYQLEVKPLKRAMRVDRSLLDKVEGLGSKFVRRMRREAVDCPVKNRTVSFLECFTCPNFIRRFKGVVYCKGDNV